jgi:hypothetical protein
MSKKLVLSFATDGKGTLGVSLNNPKDNLTLDEVKAAAEKAMPVLATSGGVLASAFDSAKIVTTTVEVLE